MSDNEERQMWLLAACLHEQLDRLLPARKWAQGKKMKRLVGVLEDVERMATPHRQMVEQCLGRGSEKEVGEVDRQSTSPVGQLAKFGVSALSGHAAETDDGM